MTSWVGMPLIGSIKYSWRINDNINMAAGGLVGTGSWAVPEVGGGLAFASITFGDRTKNLTLTGGYGGIFFEGDSEGRGLCSVAGMAKISKNISLVFDSFIVLPRKDHVYTETFLDYNGVWVTEEHRDERQGGALFIPGIRWHQKPGRAFQFGFSGLYASGEMVPFPIPMVQWYRSF